MNWDGRDSLDRLFASVAAAGEHRTDEPGAHLDPDAILALLSKSLAGPEREAAMAHIASCGRCVDRLVAARAGRDADAIGAASGRPMPLDLGPTLFSAAVALRPDALAVLESTAVVQVGTGAPLRRGAGATRGVVLQRRLDSERDVRVEIMDLRRGQVSVGVTVEPAAAATRVSLVIGGRVRETKPLRDGQATLRRLDLRTTHLRFESPTGVLGHVALDLLDERGEDR